MNFYIVVEGARTETTIFSDWVPRLNPELIEVDHPSQLSANNFVIFSGHGYPNYFNVIRNAAIDIAANPLMGTLAVSVDAEDDLLAEKRAAINEIIDEVDPAIARKIIIQNACIESWLLGNRRQVRPFPTSAQAKYWRAFYDVREYCPELMPADLEGGRNRAATALAYLRSAIRERNPTSSYSKRRPHIVCNSAYLDQLITRRNETDHLETFGDFVRCFSPPED